MADEQTAAPDSTAVRVALWRAMHVQVDPPPHVLEDEIGLNLVARDDGWRRRPDMDPHATSLFRASIVARARFIEGLVVREAGRGLNNSISRTDSFPKTAESTKSTQSFAKRIESFRQSGKPTSRAVALSKS